MDNNLKRVFEEKRVQFLRDLKEYVLVANKKPHPVLLL